MEAIVLAGGFGTRLAQVVKDLPKPMAPVAGRPFLEYILDDLYEQGIERVILAVCHKKESIMEWFGESYRGMSIHYSIETDPLLTGGAVKQALGCCREERISIINGDTYFQVDLHAMRKYALQSRCPIAVAVKEMKDFDRYGCVEVDEEGLVMAFREKRPCERGFINGGVYDLQRDALEGLPAKFSLEKEFFTRAVKQREIAAFVSGGFFIDIGIPKDYELAQRCFYADRNEESRLF